jgi:hypothetical protein
VLWFFQQHGGGSGYPFWQEKETLSLELKVDAGNLDAFQMYFSTVAAVSQI